jgi:hypothetical protein
VFPQVQEVLEVVERVVVQLVEAVEVVVVELVVEVEVQVRELAEWMEGRDPKLVLLNEKHVIKSHRHMI